MESNESDFWRGIKDGALGMGSWRPLDDINPAYQAGRFVTESSFDEDVTEPSLDEDGAVSSHQPVVEARNTKRTSMTRWMVIALLIIITLFFGTYFGLCWFFG